MGGAVGGRPIALVREAVGKRAERTAAESNTTMRSLYINSPCSSWGAIVISHKHPESGINNPKRFCVSRGRGQRMEHIPDESKCRMVYIGIHGHSSFRTFITAFARSHALNLRVEQESHQNSPPCMLSQNCDSVPANKDMVMLPPSVVVLLNQHSNRQRFITMSFVLAQSH